MRENLMAIMGLPKERVRVITEDVGGASGSKTGPYPENIALMVGAKKFGRPIHWMSTRSEAFLSDNQARDIYSEAELALDERASSWRCACAISAISVLLSAPSAPISRPRISPAACPACTTSNHRRCHHMRLHQHHPDRALSRRRAAGSELHARARGR